MEQVSKPGEGQAVEGASDRAARLSAMAGEADDSGQEAWENNYQEKANLVYEQIKDLNDRMSKTQDQAELDTLAEDLASAQEDLQYWLDLKAGKINEEGSELGAMTPEAIEKAKANLPEVRK